MENSTTHLCQVKDAELPIFGTCREEKPGSERSCSCISASGGTGRGTGQEAALNECLLLPPPVPGCDLGDVCGICRGRARAGSCRVSLPCQGFSRGFLLWKRVCFIHSPPAGSAAQPASAPAACGSFPGAAQVLQHPHSCPENQGWVSPILSLWALCSQEDCQGSSCSYTSFPALRESSSGHTPASQEDTELPQDRVTSALEQHIPSPEQDMPSPGAGWLLHSSSALGFCCFPNAPNPIICARSLGLQPGHGCRSHWKRCQHKLRFISAA